MALRIFEMKNVQRYNTKRFHTNTNISHDAANIQKILKMVVTLQPFSRFYINFKIFTIKSRFKTYFLIRIY